MGCYGLGVSRIMQAAVEALHVGDSIRWPRPLMPYTVAILPQVGMLVTVTYMFYYYLIPYINVIWYFLLFSKILKTFHIRELLTSQQFCLFPSNALMSLIR